jgi:hypothetical protein
VPGEIRTNPPDFTHEVDVAPTDDASYCHVYVPPPQPAVFKFLRLADGSALANAKAQIRCADGTMLEGTTDGNGLLRVYGRSTDVFTLVGVTDSEPDKDHQLATCDPAVDGS